MNALKNTKQSKTWPFLQIQKTCLDGNICVKKREHGWGKEDVW
jgi:hypothetical protein